MSLVSRIANVFRSDRLNREIQEELDSHIEEAIALGRDPAEARRALGHLPRHHQQGHDFRVVAWLESLLADIVFGWRQLKRNKVTSAAAILSLALAMGSCVAAFRLIDALLWRPLPVANPERLYGLSRQGIGPQGTFQVFDSWAYPDFLLMRDAVQGRAQLLGVDYADRTELTYKSAAEMEKATLQHVSANLFVALGIRPSMGRVFYPVEDLKPSPQAILSYDYWSRRFHRDPHAVGSTFRIGDTLYEIIGVASPKFTGTEPGIVVDIFLPMSMHGGLERENWSWFRTLALVQPGVAIEPLRAQLEAISRDFEARRMEKQKNLSSQMKKNFIDQHLLMTPSIAGVSGMQANYQNALATIAVLVLLVLFIACVNIANLKTAQAAARAREMALRISIGAGRWRLVRLVVIENILLACAASVLGTLFAWWSAPFVVAHINPPDNPARLILDPDWRVLAFAVALTFAVTLLFGFAPALRASSVQPVSAIKAGSSPRAQRRLMHWLITAQVAFCFLVLFLSGLFAATLQHLINKPTGFTPDRLLLLEAVPHTPQSPIYWEQVADHLRQQPGVESVALCGWPLLTGYAWNCSISVDGSSNSDKLVYLLSISPGWINTMRMPLLAGRDFRTSDTYPGSAIVNQAFVRQFLHGADPIGRTVYIAGENGERDPVQIVGLTADTTYRDIHEDILPIAWLPFRMLAGKTSLLPVNGGTFVVRVDSRSVPSGPMALAHTLRAEITRTRSDFYVSNISTQQSLLEALTVRERLLAMLAVFFAGVALLLAAIGLYGVLNYSVLQREREFGIRIAVGARIGSIVRLVTAQVFFMVPTGAIAGAALGLPAGRYLQDLLYGVESSDPAMLALPAVALLTAALLSAIPAVIRAARIDPAIMLRAE